MTLPFGGLHFGDRAHTGIAGMSRRRYVGGVIGAAATAAVVNKPASAKQSALRLIDTHHHFYPPEYEKLWMNWDGARKIPRFPAQVAWSQAKAIEDMDQAGIRVAVLSLPSTPGVWMGLNPGQASRLAHSCNEFGAAMVRNTPGRFGLFASLSMLDIDKTLGEIEYALDTLKADGIELQSNYGDIWLGDAKYAPVLEELNRRNALIFVHPLVATCDAHLGVGVPPAVIEVPHDTTRTIVSLLVSGGFARWRNIEWLFSHAGGTIPMMASRIQSAYYVPKLKELAPDGVMAELRRLNYDTANATSASIMAALLKLVPTSQVTYGTDYPYYGLDQMKNLKRLGIDASNLKAIGSENAIRLIPRLEV